MKASTPTSTTGRTITTKMTISMATTTADYWFLYAFNFAKFYFGRGNVTTIPDLFQSKLAELPIALLPLSEQEETTNALNPAGRKTEVAERKKVQLRNLFHNLLHQMMTAKIRVHGVASDDLQDTQK